MSEWREDIEAIKTRGLAKVLYWRFVYRHHMRFIHKRGGHVMKHYGPLLPDGGEFDRCDWCGHIENIVPQRTPFMDYLSRRPSITPSQSRERKNEMSEPKTSFEEWCKQLDAHHENLRQTEEGFEGYGAGAITEITGKECWLDYYDNDYCPEDALAEDRSYWGD